MAHLFGGMLVQLYRRRGLVVRSSQLLEALEELPDEIKDTDLLAKFPNMCKAWPKPHLPFVRKEQLGHPDGSLLLPGLFSIFSKLL